MRRSARACGKVMRGTYTKQERDQVNDGEDSSDRAGLDSHWRRRMSNGRKRTSSEWTHVA
jgi:hypothetical protein